MKSRYHTVTRHLDQLEPAGTRHPTRYHAARNILKFLEGGMVGFFEGGAVRIGLG